MELNQTDSYSPGKCDGSKPLAVSRIHTRCILPGIQINIEFTHKLQPNNNIAKLKVYEKW